jgi:peroxiredoxin
VTKTVSTLFLCLAVSLGLWTTACSNSKTTSAKDRKAAPDFELKDANGQSVRLADYKGKVVLLDFWATWCGPCKVEIPWFMEFEKQYKDRGFAVVGVSMDDDGWTVVKPYISRMKMNYQILVGNDEVGTKYGGIESLPTTFLIDREGRIAAKHVGLSGKENFRNDILRLLDAPSASTGNPGGRLVASVTSAK